jgi:hypothetical protein
MSIDFSPLNKGDIYQGAVAQAQQSNNAYYDRALKAQQVRAHAAAEMMNAQNGQDANMVNAQQVQNQGQYQQGQLASDFQQNQIAQQGMNQQGAYQQGQLQNAASEQDLRAQMANQTAGVQMAGIGQKAQEAQMQNQVSQQNANTQQQGMQNLGQYQQGENQVAQGELGVKQQAQDLQNQQFQYQMAQRASLKAASQFGLPGIRQWYVSQGMAKEAQDIDKGEADTQNAWYNGAKTLLEVQGNENQYKAGQIAQDFGPRVMAYSQLQPGTDQDNLYKGLAQESDQKYGTNLSDLPNSTIKQVFNLQTAANYAAFQKMMANPQTARAGIALLNGVINQSMNVPEGSISINAGNNADQDNATAIAGFQKRALGKIQTEATGNQDATNQIGNAINAVQAMSDPSLLNTGKQLFLEHKGVVPGMGSQLDPQQQDFLNARNKAADAVGAAEQAYRVARQLPPEPGKDEVPLASLVRNGYISKDGAISRLNGMYDTSQQITSQKMQRLRQGGINVSANQPDNRQGASGPSNNDIMAEYNKRFGGGQ